MINMMISRYVLSINDQLATSSHLRIHLRN